MKSFLVYATDGRVLRTGLCNAEDLQHQAAAGERVMEGVATCAGHYVKGGKVFEIPPRPSAFHALNWDTQTWDARPGLELVELRRRAYPPLMDYIDAQVKKASSDPAMQAAGEAQELAYTAACLEVKARHPK